MWNVYENVKRAEWKSVTLPPPGKAIMVIPKRSYENCVFCMEIPIKACTASMETISQGRDLSRELVALYRFYHNVYVGSCEGLIVVSVSVSSKKYIIECIRNTPYHMNTVHIIKYFTKGARHVYLLRNIIVPLHIPLSFFALSNQMTFSGCKNRQLLAT